jgi:hypothetical protein
LKSTGSGRRKRVSARHQVKRLDPGLWKSSLFQKSDPAEETGFSSFGADLRGPQFHRLQSPIGSEAKVKSGPDVFADALVPGTLMFLVLVPGRRMMPGVQISKSLNDRPDCPQCAGACIAPCLHWAVPRSRGASRSKPALQPIALSPMVIVSRNCRVNRIPRPLRNPRETGAFAICRR